MDRFNEYLNDIDIDTRPLLNRVENHLHNCQLICPEEINDIFVSEFRDEANKRIYDAIVFFSENFIIEATNPFSQIQSYNISSFKNCIELIDIEALNYNINQKDRFENDSRLKIKIGFAKRTPLYGEFKASTNNCLHLVNLFFERFKPNMFRN